jgi:hypothetical protein
MTDWYRAAQVSVNNGSAIVTVVSGEEVAAIRKGDGLRIVGFEEVEILSAYVDGSTNDETIRLRNAWAGASQTLAAATVIPHAVHFNTGAQALIDTKDKVFGQLASFFLFSEKATGTVTFSAVGVGSSDITLRTIPQYKLDLDALESSAIGSVTTFNLLDEALNGDGGLIEIAAEVEADLAAVDSTLQGYVSTALGYKNSALSYRNSAQTYRDTTLGYRDTTKDYYDSVSTWKDQVSGNRTATDAARDLAEQYRDEAEAFKDQAGQIAGGDFASNDDLNDVITLLSKVRKLALAGL